MRRPCHERDDQGLLEAGNVRCQPFREIWEQSPLFGELRNSGLLGGRCGLCEFKNVYGGCRVRAYGMTMEYLGEEPFCTYEPAWREGQTRKGQTMELSA